MYFSTKMEVRNLLEAKKGLEILNITSISKSVQAVLYFGASRQPALLHVVKILVGSHSFVFEEVVPLATNQCIPSTPLGLLSRQHFFLWHLR